MNIFKKNCSEIFEIEKVENSLVPLLNFKFINKKRFENDLGFGIYFLKFLNEIIYIGSYSGQKDGVSKLRWWTHIASISSRFREINFLKQDNPYLSSIKNNKQHYLIKDLLHLKKKKFYANYFNVSNNHYFKNEIFDNILNIEDSDEENLPLLLGDGRCMTFPKRIACANKYWNDIRVFNEKDLLNNYNFFYYRISENKDKFRTLVNFLYSDFYPIKLRKSFFRDFIEQTIINTLLPCANTIKNIKNFDINYEIINDSHNVIDFMLKDINSRN